MPFTALLPHLPPALRGEVLQSLRAVRTSGGWAAELRLRCGRIASVSLYRAGRLSNLPLRFRATEEEMRSTLSSVTGGSFYAHEEELKEGFFTLDGIRVGVTGEVMADSPLSLTSIGSIVFRLPAKEARAEALVRFYHESEGGILLFAPPGGGKTTQLRALAAAAARTARVAVIDTRRELLFSDGELLLDRLVGYPKAKGAEIAVRTLSPELLILDEIGVREANDLCALVSFGVRTVASIHAESGEELLSRPSLRPLLSSGLFSHLWDVVAERAFSLWEELR